MNKVLVADDNKDILWVMEMLLKKYGFDVLTTPRGEEVVNVIKQYHPQVVILDVYMSGVDGREICNKLKTDEETKSIPVILFSAHTNSEETMKVCKADDFVSKPFDAKDLIKRINFQIDHRWNHLN